MADRVKLTIVAADLTLANGEWSGIVETTITREGRTETTVQHLGGKPKKKRRPAGRLALKSDGGGRG